VRAAIGALTKPFVANPAVDYIDEHLLHRVVINEGSKAYHTKSVDKENRKGLFLGYKTLSEDIADIFLEINPDFPYPRTLATSLFEMAHNNPYFAEHLPRLTDLKAGDNLSEKMESLLYFWVERLVGVEKKVPAGPAKSLTP
jgi:hypothetical protein